MIHASRLRRRLAAVAAAGVAAGGVASSVAPALAATAPAASGRAQAVTAAATTHVYRTQATGLRVRARATTKSRVLGVLGKAGSKVTVNCYVLGQPIAGDAVWYHITRPKAGYVAGFYLNTGGDPAAGVPRCFYRTKVTGLAVRKAPTTKSRRLGVLGKAGSKVTVRCYALGQAIAGDTVWYRITKPRAGYVAGFYLNTGRDPAAGIARC